MPTDGAKVDDARGHSGGAQTRPVGHPKRDATVLAKLCSGNLCRLHRRRSSMHWPGFFCGSKTITRDTCDLVISPPLNRGRSLRVANGGLQLVYDTSIRAAAAWGSGYDGDAAGGADGTGGERGQVDRFSCWVELRVYRGRDPAGEEADGSFCGGGRAGCEDGLSKIFSVDDVDKPVARRDRYRDRTSS
jgi:hypothetical protein